MRQPAPGTDVWQDRLRGGTCLHFLYLTSYWGELLWVWVVLGFIYFCLLGFPESPTFLERLRARGTLGLSLEYGYPRSHFEPCFLSRWGTLAEATACPQWTTGKARLTQQWMGGQCHSLSWALCFCSALRHKAGSESSSGSGFLAVTHLLSFLPFLAPWGHKV